jgi:hypothetical protein
VPQSLVSASCRGSFRFILESHFTDILDPCRVACSTKIEPQKGVNGGKEDIGGTQRKKGAETPRAFLYDPPAFLDFLRVELFASAFEALVAGSTLIKAIQIDRTQANGMKSGSDLP